MTSNSSVSCFRLKSSISVHQDRCHQSKRTETLSNDIRLHISIVVLASPYEVSTGLDCLGNHIINKSVLVVNSDSLHLVLVLLLVNSLESILEKSIVLLQDRVFRRELEWKFSVDGVLHTGVHEGFDGLLGVEHAHVGSFALEVVELLLDWSAAVVGDKLNVGLSWLVDNLVLASVLVTISVSTNDNGLSPAWHQSRDI